MSIQKSTTFLSLNRAKEMPAIITPGFYNIQFGQVYSGESNAPMPEPLYLTNNGEGKQLTVKTPTGELGQEVNCITNSSHSLIL